MQAPDPTHVSSARQFFNESGTEFFVAEARGRRPDVRDALRSLGVGPNRMVAERQAKLNWQSAWCSLATKSRSTSE